MRYIIANWKMNLNLKDITNWLETFKKELPKIPADKQVILAPSFPYLGLMSTLENIKGLALAAQDVSIYDRGAHTGDVSAFQIADFCSYCIIGHSERKEDNKTAGEKQTLCIQNNVMPIRCFSSPEKLVHIMDPAQHVFFAWEDPENISVNGTYRAKNTEDIKESVGNIRQILAKEDTLIYGGSVNRQNIKNLANIDGLDGVLVGNASNDAVHFAEIVKTF